MKEIQYIYLYVQVYNEISKNFYLKWMLEIVKTIDNYYTNIEPKGAYYLRLKLNH